MHQCDHELADPSTAFLAAAGGHTVKLFDASVESGDPCTLSYTPSPGFQVNSEAPKRMKIKKPPQILVIHLKRFKYIEQLSGYKKFSYHVVFPLELKLSNTVEDTDSEYSLFAVVVHVGSGPNHGHYVSLVKSHNHWLFFDDENVEIIDESAVQTFFGSAQEYSSNTDHGYILLYERLGAVSSKGVIF
ncbi:hypothetical protein RHMOL_Rhmol08G0013100 [Rhododendron molle]|uniref:Uncharacterized protein n=1 Tax=Rhododendron molle TaxID=49168 RepID=A0ACC0MIJ6_RHOML|nr:hypothetical protein RHMOL_Rhmol08G0013100 [Rhododendron molle]